VKLGLAGFAIGIVLMFAVVLSAAALRVVLVKAFAVEDPNVTTAVLTTLFVFIGVAGVTYPR
jgi:hypothetical protein